MNYQDLLDVIDSRSSGSEKNYAGIVTAVTTNNKKATVKITGGDTEFEFYNKTGEKLSIGDSVYIHSFSSGLTGGFISFRFGEPVWLWEG